MENPELIIKNQDTERELKGRREKEWESYRKKGIWKQRKLK